MYTIREPQYRLEQSTHSISCQTMRDALFLVTEECTAMQDGLLCVRRCWKNIGSAAIEFQPIFAVETHFSAESTLIPCVSINGNQWGRGKEPKGLLHDGKPWVFSGFRSSIPACTISENADHAFALFAAPAGNAGGCSCSLQPLDGNRMLHRILWPVIEEPLSYIDRDVYGPASQTYVRLAPGECFETAVCCWCGKPRWPHYGAASLLDAIDGLFPLRTQPARKAEELWHLGICFARQLAMEIHGQRLLCIGFGKDGPNGEFLQVPHFEIGFCGQNLTYARMLIRDYTVYGHQDSLDLALDVLDGWLKGIHPATGLVTVHYEKLGTPEGRIADTCNLGSAALEYLRCYRALLAVGIDKPDYLKAAAGICDFFAARCDGREGFGKAWDIASGSCICNEGTVGAFMIAPLAELYEWTGQEKYLSVAEEAFRWYDRQDLQRFCCTAGALDTDCIDKETSGPMLMSALILHRLTHDPCYLEAALRAAYYFASFMYVYDVPYAADSDFVRYGFTTCGATSVSAQHHHIDAWGVCLVPAFMQLSDLTGDARWRRRAKAMWDCYTVGVADDCTYIHGAKRPKGSQNEGWMHVRWNNRMQEPKPGSMNDWLVAWPGAFRLSTIAALGSLLDDE